MGVAEMREGECIISYTGEVDREPGISRRQAEQLES
jgi:hypothetical protein